MCDVTCHHKGNGAHTCAGDTSEEPICAARVFASTSGSIVACDRYFIIGATNQIPIGVVGVGDAKIRTRVGCVVVLAGCVMVTVVDAILG